MSRTIHKLAAIASIVVLAACNDSQPVGLTPPHGGVATVTPSGTLDQNIYNLFALFPNGLSNAGLSQWKNIKAKYSAGQTDPQQLAVAKKMLVELVKWVQNKTNAMNTPPAGETKDAAASRLVLYMSEYVYNGPTFTPPVYTPAADVAVAVVEPTAGDTIVTPAEVAGIGLEAGSVAEPTIFVVTQNPTPYPDNCSGPLQTKLCQYPRFYTFDQFPHVKLLKPAKLSVCHVSGDVARAPLADHDRFRLAHTLPANPADYTPGSTIRNTGGEAIEILPLITQTFVNCGNVEMTASGLRRGVLGKVTRLAKNVVKFFAPTTAYAIDQGFGGETLEFSDFNDVDPQGVPDNSVDTVAATSGPYHEGDHVTYTYTVSNNGTATADPVPVDVLISSDSVFGAGDIVAGSDTLPALVPGQSVNRTFTVVIPSGVPTGSQFMGIRVANSVGVPEDSLGNNHKGSWASFQAPFVTVNNTTTMSVGEATVCSLTPAGAMYCWGDNGVLGPYKQYGTTQPTSHSPVAVSVPAFAEFARGHAQHKCGITSAGSAICWGRGFFGQLGRGVVEATGNTPATVVGGITWASMTTSRLLTCGVSTTGVGYCFGSNQHGEIGSAAVPIAIPPATITKVTSPHVIDGGHVWKSVVAGWLHACGIDTAGAAWCWGANDNGQLGIGPADTLNHQSPVPVLGGMQWIQLATGSRQTCGITVDHLAYCWGENGTGQMGNGTYQIPTGVPTLVGNPSMHFSLIAPASGFGDGSTVALPTGIGQGNVGTTCALNERGAAYCWGWNGNGALGDGSVVDHYSPMPVAGGHLFTDLQVGGAAVCGKWFNQIWCWGANAIGQLGNGTVLNAALPSLVASPFDTP